jgi:hypothetical protein
MAINCRMESRGFASMRHAQAIAAVYIPTTKLSNCASEEQRTPSTQNKLTNQKQHRTAATGIEADCEVDATHFTFARIVCIPSPLSGRPKDAIVKQAAAAAAAAAALPAARFMPNASLQNGAPLHINAPNCGTSANYSNKQIKQGNK